MIYKLGDAVIHKSDKKLRKMVVAGIAIKEANPTTIHNERANIGFVQNGSYYCPWISGTKKGDFKS